MIRMGDFEGALASAGGAVSGIGGLVGQQVGGKLGKQISSATQHAGNVAQHLSTGNL